MNDSDWSRTDLSSPVFDVYDELLVPLIFQPYADDVANRLTDMRAGSILEVAAGTGVVTRALAAALPDEVAITASDLIPGMLARAQRTGTTRPVTWQQANVMELPFESESFDVAVCQFGAMFFDPKSDAFAEVRRVLQPGGRFIFSVWDGLDRNETAAVVSDAVKRHFGDDPPRFLERMPYSYNDAEAITAHLRGAGFETPPTVERLEFESRAASAADIATALCGGTPLRDEIVNRGPDALSGAIEAATAAVAERFGSAESQSLISAQVFVAVR